MQSTPPLAPHDCDLRSMDWFPFHHKKLPRSKFWLHASDTAKAVSVELWCEAYEQVPAGSLPNDDVALADASGFGRRAVHQWQKVKDEVMAEWTLCRDNRWYHPTLSKIAVKTFHRNLKERSRKNNNAAAKAKVRVAEIEAEFAEILDLSVPATENDQQDPGNDSGNEKEIRGTSAELSSSSADVPRTSEDDPGPVHGNSEISDVTRQDNTLQDRTPQDNIPPTSLRSVSPPPGDGTAEEKALADLRENPGKAPNRKGSRLCADWTLPPEDQQWAEMYGLQPLQITQEADKFRDHWLQASGRSAAKCDWSAAWRNWIRRGFPAGSAETSPKSADDPVLPADGSRTFAQNLLSLIGSGSYASYFGSTALSPRIRMNGEGVIIDPKNDFTRQRIEENFKRMLDSAGESSGMTWRFAA